jgi:hypothetical protein
MLCFAYIKALIAGLTPEPRRFWKTDFVKLTLVYISFFFISCPLWAIPVIFYLPLDPLFYILEILLGKTSISPFSSFQVFFFTFIKIISQTPIHPIICH